MKCIKSQAFIMVLSFLACLSVLKAMHDAPACSAGPGSPFFIRYGTLFLSEDAIARLKTDAGYLACLVDLMREGMIDTVRVRHTHDLSLLKLLLAQPVPPFVFQTTVCLTEMPAFMLNDLLRAVNALGRKQGRGRFSYEIITTRYELGLSLGFLPGGLASQSNQGLDWQPGHFIRSRQLGEPSRINGIGLLLERYKHVAIRFIYRLDLYTGPIAYGKVYGALPTSEYANDWDVFPFVSGHLEAVAALPPQDSGTMWIEGSILTDVQLIQSIRHRVMGIETEDEMLYVPLFGVEPDLTLEPEWMQDFRDQLESEHLEFNWIQAFGDVE